MTLSEPSCRAVKRSSTSRCSTSRRSPLTGVVAERIEMRTAFIWLKSDFALTPALVHSAIFVAVRRHRKSPGPHDLNPLCGMSCGIVSSKTEGFKPGLNPSGFQVKHVACHFGRRSLVALNLGRYLTLLTTCPALGSAASGEEHIRDQRPLESGFLARSNSVLRPVAFSFRGQLNDTSCYLSIS